MIKERLCQNERLGTRNILSTFSFGEVGVCFKTAQYWNFVFFFFFFLLPSLAFLPDGNSDDFFFFKVTFWGEPIVLNIKKKWVKIMRRKQRPKWIWSEKCGLNTNIVLTAAIFVLILFCFYSSHLPYFFLFSYFVSSFAPYFFSDVVLYPQFHVVFFCIIPFFYFLSLLSFAFYFLDSLFFLEFF